MSNDDHPVGGGPKGGSGFGHIVSLTTGLLGVSLIVSGFTNQHESTGLFILDNWLQIIMLLAGSLAILISVLTFYLRKNPDKWGW